jgi:hypothetical protein
MSTGHFKIEDGWNGAEQDELAGDREVRAHMQGKKRVWIEQQRQA